MYYLIIYLMIFSSFVSFFVGTFMGSFIVFFNSFFLMLSLFLTNLVFFETLINNFITNIRLGNWFYNLNVYFNFELIFDQLSTTMLYVIITVSFFVHLFSIFYIKFDPNYNKFFFYLTLFTLFMSILVLSNNFIQFFLGWEGIGLCSYLLINFWTNRLEANKSAIKALVLNKIGDCSLYIFFVFYYFIFDTFDINFVQILSLNFINFFVFNFNISIYDFMMFFIIIASIAKSAQLGLHVWLPDAMEGPTPVSSLLHAATMVTAGIYLLLKISWIIDLSNFNCVLLFIGCFTNFFTSLISIFQFDIKKIIAYSTASQIALMFIAIGLSSYTLAFFHLFTHAFFKALLFLSAGFLIHNFKNLQDFRNFNNSFNSFSFIYNIINLGDLILLGLPFMSSYYSKDAIVFLAGVNFDYFMCVSFVFCDLSIFFTVFYTFRSLTSVFIQDFNYELFKKKINDYDFYAYFPLFALAIFSMFNGYIFYEFFNNPINYYFKDVFMFNLNNFAKLNDFYTVEISDLVIIFFTFLGLFVGYYFDYIVKFIYMYFNLNNFKILILFCKKWFFDTIYYYNIIIFLNFIFSFVYKFVDKILLEFVLDKKLVLFIKKESLFFSIFQLGKIHFYIFITIFFIFFLFFFLTIQFFVIYILLLLFEFYNNNNAEV